MSTRSVDVMLSRPGIYVVFSYSGAVFVEVEDGRCHQLTLTDYQRDGELSPGGWHLPHISAIHGPFQRAAAEIESIKQRTPEGGDHE